jgi:zinc transport system substrate-binding protein
MKPKLRQTKATTAAVNGINPSARRRIMKRLLIIIFTLALSASLLSACNGRESSGGKINVTVTIFPQYDWVRQIIGEENMDRFNLTLLIDNRIDLHSYSPSVSDIAAIKRSDVFIYIGGHSDSWVEGVLHGSNPDMFVMNLMEQLDISRLLEGFCDEHCDEDHDHALGGGFLADEHIWLSLPFAQVLVASIANMLSEADSELADVYQANAAAYISKLSDLDADYRAVAAAASVRTLVFADRFPFRYMMNDYGIAHYAAFQGCSAESEAGFVTIISLANRVNQHNLGVVMVTETSDQSIARTVINSTNAKNQRILVLDGMKAVTAADIRSGVTYLSIMENNLEVLKEALN